MHSRRLRARLPYSRPFVIDRHTGGLPGGMPPAGVYLYVFEP